MTGLADAAVAGNARELRKLLARGGDCNAVDDAGVPMIHLAAGCPKAAALDVLLWAGADPDRLDPRRRTALHCAVGGGKATVRALLQTDVDVDAVDDLGQTALLLAARRALDVRVWDWQTDGPVGEGGERYEIRHGQMWRCTPEGRVALSGRDERRVAEKRCPAHLKWLELRSCVRALVRAGAHINRGDRDGVTPLHLVVEMGDAALTGELINKGGDIGAVSGGGDAIAHALGRTRNRGILGVVGLRDVDVEVADSAGRTPLHFAAIGGVPEIVARFCTASLVGSRLTGAGGFAADGRILHGVPGGFAADGRRSAVGAGQISRKPRTLQARKLAPRAPAARKPLWSSGAGWAVRGPTYRRAGARVSRAMRGGLVRGPTYRRPGRALPAKKRAPIRSLELSGDLIGALPFRRGMTAADCARVAGQHAVHARLVAAAAEARVVAGGGGGGAPLAASTVVEELVAGRVMLRRFRNHTRSVPGHTGAIFAVGGRVASLHYDETGAVDPGTFELVGVGAVRAGLGDAGVPADWVQEIGAVPSAVRGFAGQVVSTAASVTERLRAGAVWLPLGDGSCGLAWHADRGWLWLTLADGGRARVPEVTETSAMDRVVSRVCADLELLLPGIPVCVDGAVQRSLGWKAAVDAGDATVPVGGALGLVWEGRPVLVFRDGDHVERVALSRAIGRRIADALLALPADCGDPKPIPRALRATLAARLTPLLVPDLDAAVGALRSGDAVVGGGATTDQQWSTASGEFTDAALREIVSRGRFSWVRFGVM